MSKGILVVEPKPFLKNRRAVFPRLQSHGRRPQAFGPCLPCGTPYPPNRFGGPASSPFSTGGAGLAGEGGEGGLGSTVGPGPGPGPGPTPAPRQGPEPVALLTAGDFKILAKSGITNVPTSQVIGDMGVSPIDDTAIVGFAHVLDASGEFATSAQVVGRIYAANYAPPTPAKMTQAILDMEAAYTDAAGRTPNFVNHNGGLLGGLTLVPGVYKFTSPVSIATDLTLTGGPDDTYIFQIDGTLTVGSGVEIILSGGLQAKNIVWQVAGATTIGTNALFRGNILDQTNIAVQTGATVIGKLLAQTAVTLDMNLING